MLPNAPSETQPRCPNLMTLAAFERAAGFLATAQERCSATGYCASRIDRPLVATDFTLQEAQAAPREVARIP
jgi:hypothetical protein